MVVSDGGKPPSVGAELGTGHSGIMSGRLCQLPPTRRVHHLQFPPGSTGRNLFSVVAEACQRSWATRGNLRQKLPSLRIIHRSSTGCISCQKTLAVGAKPNRG